MKRLVQRSLNTIIAIYEIKAWRDVAFGNILQRISFVFARAGSGNARLLNRDFTSQRCTFTGPPTELARMKSRITAAANELVYLANFLVEYERGGEQKKQQHKPA